MAKNLFSKHNNNFTFDLPEGLWSQENFIKAADALEKYVDGERKDGCRYSSVLPIIGYGITKINKEEHPNAVSDRSAWVATETEIINIPQHQLEKIEEFLGDKDYITACLNGEMGVRLEEYDCKYGRRVKAEWIDL